MTAKNATRIQRLWRGLRTRLMFSDMLEYVRMMAEIRTAANKKKARLSDRDSEAPSLSADAPKPSPKAAAPEAAKPEVVKPAGHRYPGRIRTRDLPRLRAEPLRSPPHSPRRRSGSPSLPPKRSPKPAGGPRSKRNPPGRKG